MAVGMRSNHLGSERRRLWRGGGPAFLFSAASGLCVVACLVTLLAPAVRVTAQEPARLSLVAWEQPTGPELRKCTGMLADFSRQYPHLKVDMTHDSWENAYARIVRWCGSLKAHAPDMTVVPEEWVSEFAPNFCTFGTSLDRYLDPFIPAVMAPITLEGRIYGVPWQMDTHALYYRPDLLPQGRKAPTTWDELAETAAAITDQEQGVYGLGLPGAVKGGGARMLLILLWGAGGSIYDQQGQIGFTSPEMTAALEYWVRLARAGALQPEVLSWDSRQLEQAFAEGKLGMVIAGSAFATTLRTRYRSLQVDIAPLPYRDHPVASISAAYLVVMRTTEHREECTEFLKFVTSRNAQYCMWETGSVPCHRDLIAKLRNEPLQALTANLETGHTRPGQDWHNIEAMLDDALYLAIGGRCSPAEALARVQERYRQPIAPALPQPVTP